MAKNHPNGDCYYVLGEGLKAPQKGISSVPLDTWLAQNVDALVGPLPIGLAIMRDARNDLSSAIHRALEAADIPLEICESELSAETVVEWLRHALEATMGALHKARLGNAMLRRDHDELQGNFVEAEAWLHTMLAPKFVCEREIDPTENTIELAKGVALVQLLPVSSRGLLALDLWVNAQDQPPVLELVTPSKGCLVEKLSTGSRLPNGALRYYLERSLQGAPTDLALRIENNNDQPVSVYLGPKSANGAFCAMLTDAQQEAPIAMRIWKGLPGLRGPHVGHEKPKNGALPTFLMPAEIEAITSIRGRVINHETLGAIELRPERDGRGLMVINALFPKQCSEVTAYLQLLGDAGAEVTICATPIGAISAAEQAYRLPVGRFVAPAQFSHLSSAVNASPFDLVIRIEQAKPGAALWIWAIKLGAS